MPGHDEEDILACDRRRPVRRRASEEEVGRGERIDETTVEVEQPDVADVRVRSHRRDDNDLAVIGDDAPPSIWAWPRRDASARLGAGEAGHESAAERRRPWSSRGLRRKPRTGSECET